ncbi:hypothetical protein LUZ60_006177 [Juncus effusus]|nr:hypothetical protein LUZ60_006177 [Juncus effusus]
MMDAFPRALLVLVSLFLCLCFSGVRSTTVVTHLPGFTGPLPFYLETGYETVDEENGAELFYYFIESEGNPSVDPVLLWFTGGQRCSAFCGLAFEIGPLRFVKAQYNGSLPQLEYYPYSWTKYANIIFLDSPVGAGFSHSWNPNGYEIGDEMASVQIHKFLLKWFIEHPQYLSHPLYVGGDSYAGKIAPYAAEFITRGIEAGEQPLLNFKGYLVGNPITGEKIDDNAKLPYAHGHGFISDQLYQLAKGHCVGEDYSNPSGFLCAEVMDVINELLSEINEPNILEPNCILASPNPRNEIQLRRFLSDKSVQSLPPEPPLYCRTYIHYLSYFWANDRATRQALGVKKGTVREWIRCNEELPYDYDVQSSVKYHFNVTFKGYRALVYSGDHDMVIPFLGTQTWIRSLNFSVVDGWRAWHVGGLTAGFTETFSNNLTFATVKGAGHTAPEYQPKECLAMFGRWISNQPL